MLRTIDGLFDPDFAVFPFGSGRPQGQEQVPPFSCEKDDAGNITCNIDLPGVLPDDVKVTLEEGALMIAGSRDEKEFSYRLTVRDSHDLETIKARMKNGVLTLSVDQIVKPKPKRIRIETK